MFDVPCPPLGWFAASSALVTVALAVVAWCCRGKLDGILWCARLSFAAWKLRSGLSSVSLNFLRLGVSC